MAKKKASIVDTLAERFKANPTRHHGVSWDAVRARLDANPKALKVLEAMEATGGEPDVIAVDQRTGAVTFCDCSAESPDGRRSLCFDKTARDERKEAKPKSSATEVADKIGITMLTESEYRDLQRLGEFDLKTSSWVQTPPAIRRRGGALFCDRRYGEVFVYHNGAQSYYAARGFRGRLTV